MPTNLETELKANKCWRIKSKRNTLRFDELLLSNEFLSPELQQQYQAKALRKVLQHCYDVVPYYRQLFQDQKISRRHLRDSTILNEIPILEKGEVDKHAQNCDRHYLVGRSESS